MANRVTKKMLEKKIESLNSWAGFPGAYIETVSLSGKSWKAIPGAFVLDAAYGGYRLCQITSESGGEQDLTPRASARDCLDFISVYWQGMLAGQAKCKSMQA